MTKTALITGASSGLGKEFARLFAVDKWDLVLVARSEDKLRDLADQLQAAHGITAHAIAADLASDAGVQSVVGALSQKGIVVDALVNNAGFGAYGNFWETDAAKERGMIDLNITALTMLTKALLPGMIARKRGKILNVASLAAFLPGPLLAVYYATKVYVLSFSMAIRNELHGTGVTVTCLCPGPTKTHFSDAAQVGNALLFRHGLMDAKTVALAGYRGCMREKGVVIPGLRNKISALLAKIAPPSWAAAAARRAQGQV
jgi:short-subunit dehydrogenase